MRSTLELPDPTQISVVDARSNLSEILNRVHFGKEQIVLVRHGKPVAAIVPMAALALLERYAKELEQVPVQGSEST